MTDEANKIVVQEIARCQPRLRAFLRCLLVRSSDLDDLLQEINAVLWEKAADFQPGTDFWAWASQVARFQALNQLRRYSRDRLVFDPEVLEQLATVAQQRMDRLEERREALEQCLRKLPPPQRRLIDLRYLDGHAMDRIAQSIGRSPASIRQTLFRIRNSLRDCIERRMAVGGAGT
ncbi:MAG: sigma-70 family RNA polymerase sigma factor [Planctomycetaceae bacterium]